MSKDRSNGSGDFEKVVDKEFLAGVPVIFDEFVMSVVAEGDDVSRVLAKVEKIKLDRPGPISGAALVFSLDWNEVTAIIVPRKPCVRIRFSYAGQADERCKIICEDEAKWESVPASIKAKSEGKTVEVVSPRNKLITKLQVDMDAFLGGDPVVMDNIEILFD